MSLYLAESIALAIVISWLIDRYLGEPNVAWHPVVWMGHYLNYCGQGIAPKASEAANEVANEVENEVAKDETVKINIRHIAKQFLTGVLAWLFAAILLAWGALQLQHMIATLAWYWQGILLGVLLKPLFSWQMLRDEVVAVETALQNSLNAGRDQLARLVSREVKQLQAHEVRESAIETLAENLNDSVISPMFWFVLAGLPGVLLYRFANTADAMWGYRGERGGRIWTWAGKWAAHADDFLSWPGARFSALLMYLSRAQFPDCRLWREAKKTSSPNGGWPMGAMALILNIRLSKSGVYILNVNGTEVDHTHIALAVGLCEKAIWWWFGSVGLFLFGIHWI
ncbi:MAG: cobalamin biosynthesis protein [Undibacterium sp.]|nr:cobalamin biosynthesis protein [Undibacterium sp.]